MHRQEPQEQKMCYKLTALIDRMMDDGRHAPFAHHFILKIWACELSGRLGFV